MPAGVSLDLKNAATFEGALKLVQVVIGAICTGIVGYQVSVKIPGSAKLVIGAQSDEFYFLLVTCAFMIMSIILFLSSLVDGESQKKSFLEVVYHFFAFLFYVTASTALLVLAAELGKYEKRYNSYMAAGVLGFANSILYVVSTVFSYRNFKAG